MRFRSIIFFAITVSLVAVIATVGGCDEAMMFDCTYDSDCFGDEHCINSQCTPQCSRDEDCPSTLYCGVYQRRDETDPLQVCLDPDDDETGCESDQECREKLDDDLARCGIHHSCVLTPEQQDDDSNAANDGTNSGAVNAQNQDSDPTTDSMLVVEQLDADGQPVVPDDNDDSEDEDLIDDSELLPVRIAAVVVRDEAGDAVGFGEIANVTGSDETTSAALGYPVDEEGTCVAEPQSAEHASLGAPGGRAFIELLDDPGVPLEPTDGWQIQIIADGPQCPIGGMDYGDNLQGQYRVFLCSTDIIDDFYNGDECSHHFQGPYSSFSDLEVTDSR